MVLVSGSAIETGVVSAGSVFENVLESMIFSPVIVEIIGRMPIDLLARESSLAGRLRHAVRSSPVPTAHLLNGILTSAAQASS